MNLLRLSPVILSFLLIAAHFQRAGHAFMALACLLAPGLLYVTRPWSVRILQTLLLLAAAEWLRTLLFLVQLREEHGLPWTRLAVILALVAILTGGSALLFQLRAVRRRYGL